MFVLLIRDTAVHFSPLLFDLQAEQYSPSYNIILGICDVTSFGTDGLFSEEFSPVWWRELTNLMQLILSRIQGSVKRGKTTMFQSNISVLM